MNRIHLVLLGAAAGFLCGLLGVGGGVILVLALTKFLHYDQHFAQATAISVIFASSISSALAYYSAGSLEIAYIIPTLIGSCLGGWIGAVFMSRLSSKQLQLFFAFFMLIAGVRMLW